MEIMDKLREDPAVAAVLAQSATIKTLRARVAELEAENKKLRNVARAEWELGSPCELCRMEVPHDRS